MILPVNPVIGSVFEPFTNRQYKYQDGAFRIIANTGSGDTDTDTTDSGIIPIQLVNYNDVLGANLGDDRPEGSLDLIAGNCYLFVSADIDITNPNVNGSCYIGITAAISDPLPIGFYFYVCKVRTEGEDWDVGFYADYGYRIIDMDGNILSNNSFGHNLSSHSGLFKVIKVSENTWLLNAKTKAQYVPSAISVITLTDDMMTDGGYALCGRQYNVPDVTATGVLVTDVFVTSPCYLNFNTSIFNRGRRVRITLDRYMSTDPSEAVFVGINNSDEETLNVTSGRSNRLLGPGAVGEFQVFGEYYEYEAHLSGDLMPANVVPAA